MNLKPHVSPALKHLRHSVTLSGLAIAACAIIQMMIFGFVHFTEVRWVEIKPTPTVSSLAVVDGARLADPNAPIRQRRAVEAQTIAAERIPSRWAGTLEDFSAIAVTVGVLAACVFVGMTILAVCVAAGGAVPGVERAVTAATWSIIIAGLALPWRDFLPSMPFPGIFGSYEAMLAASDHGAAGGAARMFLTYLILPLAGVVASIYAVLVFRSGVRAGIISNMISEVDEMLEREIAGIRARGVSSNVGGRGSSSLTRTIGEPAGAIASPLPQDLLAGIDRTKAFRDAEESRAHRAANSHGKDGDYRRPL